MQIDQYTMSWKLPNLAMKAKFFAYLTIEQQYRAETKEVIQQLLQIMYDAGVTTREEVEGYFFFSGCYTGYTRNEALKHKLLDPPAALGSRRVCNHTQHQTDPGPLGQLAYMLPLGKRLCCGLTSHCSRFAETLCTPFLHLLRRPHRLPTHHRRTRLLSWRSSSRSSLCLGTYSDGV